MPRKNDIGVTEVAHIRTNLDAYGNGLDRIKLFSEFKKQIEETSNEKEIRVILFKVEEVLGIKSANKMIDDLNLPFSKGIET